MNTVRPKIREILVSWLPEEKTDFLDLWIHTDLLDYGRTATMVVNARVIGRIFPRLGEEALTVARFFHKPEVATLESAEQAVVDFAKEEHTPLFDVEDEYDTLTHRSLPVATWLRNAGLDKERYVIASIARIWREALRGWLPPDMDDRAFEHFWDYHVDDFALSDWQLDLVAQVRGLQKSVEDEAKARMDSVLSTFAAAEGLSSLKGG